VISQMPRFDLVKLDVNQQRESERRGCSAGDCSGPSLEASGSLLAPNAVVEYARLHLGKGEPSATHLTSARRERE